MFDIVNLYVFEKNSLSQISNKTGLPKSTIRFRLKKIGVLRGISESVSLAGKQGRMSRYHARNVSQSTKIKMSLSAKKRWNGKAKGFSLKPSGYIEITTGENKGRLAHIIEIEKQIGRRLYSNECVHHKNGDKADNRLDNLQLLTRSEHSSLHAKENNINRQRTEKGRYS